MGYIHCIAYRKLISAQFYTDHLLEKTKYLEGNMGERIYTTGKFTVAYPCIKSFEIVYTLQTFADDVGIPDIFRLYLVTEITGKHT